MDLSKYPMDTQTCQLQLESCEYMSRSPPELISSVTQICVFTKSMLYTVAFLFLMLITPDLALLTVRLERFGDCSKPNLPKLHILGRTTVH